MAVEEEIYDGVDEEPEMLTDEEERLSAQTQTDPRPVEEQNRTAVRSIMTKVSDFVTWAEDRSVPIGSVEVDGNSATVAFADPVNKEITFGHEDNFEESFVEAVQQWQAEAREKAEKYERLFRALDGLNLHIPDEEGEDNGDDGGD